MLICLYGWYAGDKLDVLTFSVLIMAGYLTFRRVSKLENLNAILKNSAWEIQSARDQLEEAQKIAKVGSWQFDVTSRNVTWSMELYRIFRLNPTVEGEKLFQAFQERVHPEDREALFAKVDRAIQFAESYEIIHRILRDDGTIRVILGRGASRRDDLTGNVVLSGTAQDITELQEKDFKTLQIINSVPALFHIRDAKGSLVSCNDAFSSFIKDRGVEPSNYSNQHESIWGTSLSQRLLKLKNEILTTGQAAHLESKIPGSQGPQWRSFYLFPLRKISGEIYAVATLSFDIDERKQAEEQLREAQEIAKIGSWRRVIRTSQLHLSAETYSIFEVDPTTPQERLSETFQSRIPAEDREAIEKVMEELHSGQDEISFDHRVVLDDGRRVKYIRANMKALRDEKGNPLSFVGTCYDRTREVEAGIQYKSLIETMHEGLVVQDETGRVVQFNPAALRILKISADEIIGITSYDKCWRAIREDGKELSGYEHPAMLVLRDGKPIHDFIMGLKGKDGETDWIRVNSELMVVGGRRFAMTTFADITKMIQANYEQRYILDTLGVGIFKYKPMTQALVWDKSMFNLFEVNENDFNGHYEAWEQSLDEKNKEVAVRELELALSGEKEFNTTFEIKTPKGNRKQIGARARVIRDSEGKPITMYGINWDRTREVELEKRFEQERLIALQTAKLASLGEMSAGIAHEINNPLTIISGNIPLLKKHREDAEKFESKVATMMGACHRIAKIVSGLRKFSRSSDGLERKNHNLKDILNEALVICEVRAKRYGVPVTFECEDDLPIHCDLVEIEQVLFNVINNAVDAVRDLPEKWVKIRAFSQESKVILHIEDSGPGIHSEIEDKIFNPFFTTKPVGEGTGLGLSISKGILDQHNSTISVNRTFAHTCFEVVFPRSTAS